MRIQRTAVRDRSSSPFSALNLLLFIMQIKIYLLPGVHRAVNSLLQPPLFPYLPGCCFKTGEVGGCEVPAESQQRTGTSGLVSLAAGRTKPTDLQ